MCLAHRPFNGRQSELCSLVAIVNRLQTRERSKKAHRRGNIWLGPLWWLHRERFGSTAERGRAHKISSWCLRLKLSSVTYNKVFVFLTRRALSFVDCRRAKKFRARNQRYTRICLFRLRFFISSNLFERKEEKRGKRSRSDLIVRTKRSRFERLSSQRIGFPSRTTYLPCFRRFIFPNLATRLIEVNKDGSYLYRKCYVQIRGADIAGEISSSHVFTW